MDDVTVTERLLCRRPVAGPEDAARYRAVLLDPALAAGLAPPPLPPLDDAAAQARLERDVAHWAGHGFGPWLLLDRGDETHVGRAGLQWLRTSGGWAVDLGWAIVAARQGRGLATETARAAVAAARRDGLRDVRVIVVASNVASRRVAEKLRLLPDGEVENAGLAHLRFRVPL